MRVIPRGKGDHLFKKTGKLMAATLIITLAGQITACGSTQLGDKFSDEPGYGKWVDSDLRGAVKADDVIRLQDDFAAAVNRETIVAHQSDEDEEWSASGE